MSLGKERVRVVYSRMCLSLYTHAMRLFIGLHFAIGLGELHAHLIRSGTSKKLGGSPLRTAVACVNNSSTRRRKIWRRNNG